MIPLAKTAKPENHDAIQQRNERANEAAVIQKYMSDEVLSQLKFFIVILKSVMSFAARIPNYASSNHHKGKTP